MSGMKCKNCGGAIIMESESNLLVCQSCGSSQSLNDTLSAEYTDWIFDKNDLPEEALKEYRRAVSRMKQAYTENALIATAEQFEQISEILNSAFLAKECRSKAQLMKTERLYSSGVAAMETRIPQKIEYAISLFAMIPGYKDADMRAQECRRILPEEQQRQQQQEQEEQRRMAQEAEQRAQQTKIKKRKRLTAAIVIILIFIAVCGIYSSLFSRSNVSITIAPDTDAYLTNRYNSSVFNYDVKIKNDSFFDISGIHADIYFEEPNGNILIDTNLSIGNYGSTYSTAVRAHKSSEYNWSVSVSSNDVAQKLYDYDFEKLDVKIKIKKISFTNGKKTSY